MFCVECGREGNVFEALCANCFLERKKLVEVSKTINITICSSCNSMLIEKRWIREDLEPTVDRLISSSLWKNPSVQVSDMIIEKRFEDIKNLSVEITMKVGLNGVQKELRERVRVRLKSGTCPSCSKRHGKYYEAILQIRPGEKDIGVDVLQDIKDYVHSRISGSAGKETTVFITKEEDIHGGVDFYISANRTARSIAQELARRFGVKMSASPKLHGRVQGKEVYRVTYIVRLP